MEFITEHKGIKIYKRTLSKAESELFRGNPSVEYEASKGMFSVGDSNLSKVKKLIDKGYLD